MYGVIMSTIIGALSPAQVPQLQNQCIMELLTEGAPIVGAKVFCECIVGKMAPDVEPTPASIQAWLAGPKGTAGGKVCSDKAQKAYLQVQTGSFVNENKRSPAAQRPSNKCYESVSVGKNRERLVEVACPVKPPADRSNGGVKR